MNNLLSNINLFMVIHFIFIVVSCMAMIMDWGSSLNVSQISLMVSIVVAIGSWKSIDSIIFNTLITLLIVVTVTGLVIRDKHFEYKRKKFKGCSYEKQSF